MFLYGEIMRSGVDLIILRKKTLRGQNVIEYLLLTAAVLVVFIVFFNPSNGPAKRALENITNDMVLDIRRLNSEIQF